MCPAGGVRLFGLAANAKQWAFLEDLEAQAETGQILTQKQTARAVK